MNIRFKLIQNLRSNVLKMTLSLLNWSLLLAYSSTYSLQESPQNNTKETTIEKSRRNFKYLLSKAKNIVVLTGEGLTHEGGYVQNYPFDDWRRYAGIDLQTEIEFMENPIIFWELYQHRRNSTLNTRPKKVHAAIANTQKRYLSRGLNFTVATLETDELLKKAGVQNIIELHGSLFKTRCLRCSEITSNYDNPITEELRLEKKENLIEDPEKYIKTSKDTLPRCQKPKCGGILRPYVWWRGDERHENVWEQCKQAIDNADFYITMGISSQSPPIRSFFDTAFERKIPTAEFGPPKDHNMIIKNDFSPNFTFQFPEFCEKSVPLMFKDLV